MEMQTDQTNAMHLLRLLQPFNDEMSKDLKKSLENFSNCDNGNLKNTLISATDKYNTPFSSHYNLDINCLLSEIYYPSN